MNGIKQFGQLKIFVAEPLPFTPMAPPEEELIVSQPGPAG